MSLNGMGSYINWTPKEKKERARVLAVTEKFSTKSGGKPPSPAAKEIARRLNVSIEEAVELLMKYYYPSLIL